MSQSSFIAACLLGGFVLWLAVNGRLSAYSKILFGSGAASSSGGSGSSGGLHSAEIAAAQNAIHALPGLGDAVAALGF